MSRDGQKANGESGTDRSTDIQDSGMSHEMDGVGSADNSRNSYVGGDYDRTFRTGDWMMARWSLTLFFFGTLLVAGCAVSYHVISKQDRREKAHVIG